MEAALFLTDFISFFTAADLIFFSSLLSFFK